MNNTCLQTAYKINNKYRKQLLDIAGNIAKDIRNVKNTSEQDKKTIELIIRSLIQGEVEFRLLSDIAY